MKLLSCRNRISIDSQNESGRVGHARWAARASVDKGGGVEMEGGQAWRFVEVSA
jgi:hypothetical protein